MLQRPVARRALDESYWRVKVISPTVTVAARRVEGGVAQGVTETLAAEVPVAIQFNGRAHAVMLATPADLDDFASGLCADRGHRTESR